MKLHELIDVPELEKLIEEGYVSARPHPTLPLKILNYTPKSVEIKEWSNTLSYCRGLVYDILTGDVVAIPFKKFWNYGDENHTDPLPTEVPRIFEKVDGSFLIGFFYKGEFIVATRGSFESDQAKWAQKWVDEHIVRSKIYGVGQYPYSHIFEVVIPEDKKVVDYNFSGLVYLGCINLNTREEYDPYPACCGMNEWLPGIRMARELEYDDLEKLQARNLDNEEGYVAVWYQDDAPAFRVKLKFERYKMLHKMYFQTTAEVIWGMVRTGQLKEKTMWEVLEGADPKLIEWANKISVGIAFDYVTIKETSSRDFRECIELTNILWDLEAPEKERRKTFAMYATKYKNPSLLFTLYDGKMVQYEKQLWDLVKPKNSRFRDQGEEE